MRYLYGVIPLIALLPFSHSTVTYEAPQRPTTLDYYLPIDILGIELETPQKSTQRVRDVYQTPDEIEKLVRETFPEESDLAVAIAMGESQLNARAYNPEAHNGCRGSYGVMQIACLHVDDPQQLFNPVYNLKVARRIYDSEGWRPWGAYTDLSYRSYIAK